MAAMVSGLFGAKLLMNNSNRTTQEDIVLLSSLGSMSTEAFGKKT